MHQQSMLKDSTKVVSLDILIDFLCNNVLILSGFNDKAQS